MQCMSMGGKRYMCEFVCLYVYHEGMIEEEERSDHRGVTPDGVDKQISKLGRCGLVRCALAV